MMRAVVACLLLLALGGVSHAQLLTKCATNSTIPCKKIRVFNNSTVQLYVIIEAGGKFGVKPADEWLQAWFKVQPTEPTRLYSSKQLARLYVGGDKGIPPNGSAEVWVPFYTQLSPNTDGTTPNQFIDWWNGGRVYFYDSKQNIDTDFTYDKGHSVLPNPTLSPLPCVALVKGSSCTQSPPVFALSLVDPNVAPGLPPTDRSQLMEFTFADAITKNGLPYPIATIGVGYNISSVDQVYLPVAMEALTENPPGLIPYIGTVLGLGSVNDPAGSKTFRRKLQDFLNDFPGWPVYNKAIGVAPDPSFPRLPGAYNVFANAFVSPPNGVLTSPGPAVTNMVNLFVQCQGSTAGICAFYNQLSNPTPPTGPTGLFSRNHYDAVTRLGCWVPPPGTTLQTEFLKKIYGWVSFNEGCTGKNADELDLLFTAGELNIPFNQFQDTVYTRDLQYSKGDAGTFTFNPYVKLIHDPKYLDMAAYAFSVDDAIGFQSYPGEGIIITFAGANGLDNKTPLDRKNRVVVTLAPKHVGIPEWESISLCNPSFVKPVDPVFTSVVFYPSSYPCIVTAKDLKGAVYQFPITHAPQPDPPGLTVDKASPPCTPNRFAIFWCNNLAVVPIAGEKNFINTPQVEPDAPASTHDHNGDGFSDILWRDTNSSSPTYNTVAMWMLDFVNSLPVIKLQSTFTGKDATWSIVGQRDFERDGKADVLWRDTSGNLERWFLNGTGIGPNVIQTQPFGNVPTNWTVAGTGDFNGDGFGDVVWRCTTTFAGCTAGQIAIWLMNDTTTLVGSSVFSVPTSWQIVGVGHFYTNSPVVLPGRNSDILWRNSNGDLAIWFMNGISIIPNVSQGVGNVPTDWSVVGTGDFNGDGFDDILWRCTNTGPNCTAGDLAIWLMKGTQILQSGGLGNVATNWTVVETGDFNFDGKSDILWRFSDGSPAIWFMNGVQIASTGSVPNPGLNWAIQNANVD